MTPTVVYCGSVNIRNSSALHDNLIAACDGECDVVLDMAEINEVDLSFLQIVYATRLYLMERGRALRLSAPALPHVVTLLGRAGFLSDPSVDDIEFWFHGELPQ